MLEQIQQASSSRRADRRSARCVVSADATPTGHPELTEAISAAMVELYAEFYGHDRANATTYINDNIVVCILESILARDEDALIASGAPG